MQAQLEKQPPQSQSDLVGRLLYVYTHYEIDNDTRNQKRTIEVLTDLATYVSTDSVTDVRVLRGLLLSGASRNKNIFPACSKELSVLDEYLLDLATACIAECSWSGWYLVAVVGNYFLEKKESEYLQQLVTAWRDAAGEHAVSGQLLSYTESTSLGFEGISGFLIMLMSIEQQVHEPVLEKIIRQGVRFVLSFQSEVDFSNQQYAIFPQAISSGRKPIKEPQSLAWGGSDLAESLLFYRAYNLFGNKQLQRTANLIGLNTLLRKEKAHLLTPDTTVYGGTASVALTYLSLYRLSGQQPYRAGYKHWIQETTSMLSADEAGGPPWTRHPPQYLGPTYDLYNGLLGTYLMLLSHQSKTELQWPGVLLLN